MSSPTVSLFLNLLAIVTFIFILKKGITLTSFDVWNDAVCFLIAVTSGPGWLMIFDISFYIVPHMAHFGAVLTDPVNRTIHARKITAYHILPFNKALAETLFRLVTFEFNIAYVGEN